MERTRGLSVLDRPVTIEAVLSVALCALLGARVDVLPFVPVAGVAGIALLPIIIPVLRRYRVMPTLLAVLGLAIIAGIALSSFNAPTHATSSSVMMARSLTVLALAGGIAAVLFAREHLGSAGAGIAYGAGMLGGILLEPISSVNAWRFTFSLPLAIFLLAVVAVHRRLWPQLIVLVGLGVVGLLNDSRSNSAMLFLAAAVLVWQRLSRAVSRGRRRAGHVLGLALVAVGFFQLMQFSLLEGYFGEASQIKSEAQVQASGSLLLGGRPEAAAAIALVGEYPLGLGSGILPSGADVYAAKSAMTAIGYDPNNGYVERFMFGNGIEVHSVLGDFWLWFGLVGVLACLAMAVIVVWGLEHGLRTATLSALLAYLSIRFFWDLLFSPVASTVWFLALTIPLAAVAVARSEHAPLSPTTPASPLRAARRF